MARAKHDYASVSHVDGTARVQLVEPDSESILRPILEEWYDETGCPVLLNTSLNIKICNLQPRHMRLFIMPSRLVSKVISWIKSMNT